MEFSSFTFTVTEDCNFSCSYCYQKKAKKYISVSTIEKAVDFFLPYLTEGCYISFYGGEPLLAFDQIRHAVNYIQQKNKGPKKQIQYSLTTNGSLINENILKFLNKHKFSILLSFDGLTQDISRKRGSFKQIVSLIEKLLGCLDIELEVNSVFTPSTIGYLSESIRYMVNLGVPNIVFSLSKIYPWNSPSLHELKEELSVLRKFILFYYKSTGNIPLIDFRRDSEGGIFACMAGKDRMALTPDGRLWGCCLFSDSFRDKEGRKEQMKYCFGDLDSFIKNHEKIYPEVLSNYSNLRMDHFYTSDTFCLLCDEIEECKACPMDNILCGSNIKKIPSWACQMKKIFRRERELFWKELES